MNRVKESNVFSGGGVIPLNNRRTLLKSYIWNYVVSDSGKATLENSIKGDIDLELGGKTEQVQTTGKNLANPSEFVIGTLAGDTGNIINLKQYITTGYIPVIPGKRYSTSCGNKFSAHTIIAYDKEKTKINSPINMSSKMPEGAAYIRQAYMKIDMTNVTESDMEELKKVCMVNESSTVLPYEPYTGLKPSPSPEYQQEIKNSGKWNEETQKYEVDVKVNGKNLFDREKARDITNWIIKDGDGYAKFPIRVGKGNKATFSYTEKLTLGKGFYLGIAQSDTGSAVGWLYHSTEINLNNNKLTVVAKGDCLYLSCNKTSIQKFFDTIQTLQVEIGSEQTVYEPYTEQTLTLTSDRPITKWDKLVEQGGQIGWLYQSKIVYLTGEEEWESNLNAFYTTTYNFIKNNAAKCSHYVLGGITNQEKNNIFSIGDGAYTNSLWIRDTRFSTARDFKAHLSDLAKKGTPIMVVSPVASTEFVPLPQSEQTQLRNLHSYNGTTHINIDSGEVECGIKVAYKQKK